jgi:hypothetical protein
VCSIVLVLDCEGHSLAVHCRAQGSDLAHNILVVEEVLDVEFVAVDLESARVQSIQENIVAVAVAEEEEAEILWRENPRLYLSRKHS